MSFRRISGVVFSLLSVMVAVVAMVLASALPGSGAAVAAQAATNARPAAGSACTTGAAGVGLIGFSDALDKTSFAGTDVGGLSALTYDKHRGVYYALVDNERQTPARFYTLRAPVDRSGFGKPEILSVTTLRDSSGQPFTGENFDGEGITVTKHGELLVSSETEPSIRRFSLDGHFLGELPVPDKFLVAPAGEGQTNKTFESLSLSPNGHSLFTANEGPLASDGQTADGRNRVRILRYDDRGPGGFAPTAEFYYQTEPGQGVSDVSALSGSELLVLERGYVPGEGNTIRIFRVSLKGAADVSGEDSLATSGTEPLKKELLVDLASCPSGGAESPGVQQNPLLDNFEGITLGPRLSGGRRELLLVSDDNFNTNQVTRLISLGARLQTGKNGKE